MQETSGSSSWKIMLLLHLQRANTTTSTSLDTMRYNSSTRNISISPWEMMSLHLQANTTTSTS